MPGGQDDMVTSAVASATQAPSRGSICTPCSAARGLRAWYAGVHAAGGSRRSAVAMSKWPSEAPTENSTPAWCRCAANSFVAPAASVRTSTATRPCSSGARRPPGTWASAASNTAT